MWSRESPKTLYAARNAFVGWSIFLVVGIPLALWWLVAALIDANSSLIRYWNPIGYPASEVVIRLIAICLCLRMSRLLEEPRWLTLLWCGLSAVWLPLYVLPAVVLSVKATRFAQRMANAEVETMNSALSGFLGGQPTREQLERWMATRGYRCVEREESAGSFSCLFSKPGWGLTLEVGLGPDGRLTVGQQIGPTHYAVPARVRQAETHDARGLDLRDRGQPHAAMSEFRKAMELCPEAPQPHMNLGTVLADLGMREEAVMEFREAVRLAPDWAEARGNLGAALHDLGRLEEAEEQLRRAIVDSPRYANAYLNLGVVLGKLGRFAEAREVLRRAVQLDPMSPKARAYLRDLEAALGHR